MVSDLPPGGAARSAVRAPLGRTRSVSRPVGWTVGEECMADSASGLERSFDRSGYSPVPSGPYGPADIPRGQEPADASQSELAALIRMGTARQDAGEFSEAEGC